MQNLNNPEPEPLRKEGEIECWPAVIADMKRLYGVDGIAGRVIEDMNSRDQIGWERYGGPLLTNDGRKPLVDAYQELLDGAVYTKKALIEGGYHNLDGLTIRQVYTTLLTQAVAIRKLIEDRYQN